MRCWRRLPGRLTFALNKAKLAGGVTATDEEVLRAMAFGFDVLKLVVEPGGAVALAALLAGNIDARGRTVGIVLSGGNVAPDQFAQALAGKLNGSAAQVRRSSSISSAKPGSLAISSSTLRTACITVV
jgi:threonine dehydratase